jgi:hypothetical protein
MTINLGIYSKLDKTNTWVMEKRSAPAAPSRYSKREEENIATHFLP